MNSQRARQQWFQCFSPDGLLTRADAVNLIRKHASKTRVFEDLEGYPALMLADKGARQLVLFTDLSDAQIRHELPTAWLREHQQVDMFRDATAAVANDERHPPNSSPQSQSMWDKIKKAFAALCH
jgi:hypothetical protein